MFVAIHAQRRCRDGSIIAVVLAEGSELSRGWWLAVQFVAAERLDVCVRDRRDAAERVVVGDDVGFDGVEVVDRGGHVAGVPDLDGVDEDLEAERVAAVVVFVGGDLGAGADHEAAAQGVECLAFVELAVDPGAERGVGAVAQQEVGADDPAVLAERDSERRLGRGVLQPTVTTGTPSRTKRWIAGSTNGLATVDGTEILTALLRAVILPGDRGGPVNRRTTALGDRTRGFAVTVLGATALALAVAGCGSNQSGASTAPIEVPISSTAAASTPATAAGRFAELANTVCTATLGGLPPSLKAPYSVAQLRGYAAGASPPARRTFESLGRLPTPRAQRLPVARLQGAYGQLLALYVAVVHGAVGGGPGQWAAAIGQHEGLVIAAAQAAGLPGCALPRSS